MERGQVYFLTISFRPGRASRVIRELIWVVASVVRPRGDKALPLWEGLVVGAKFYSPMSACGLASLLIPGKCFRAVCGGMRCTGFCNFSITMNGPLLPECDAHLVGSSLT